MDIDENAEMCKYANGDEMADGIMADGIMADGEWEWANMEMCKYGNVEMCKCANVQMCKWG